MLDSIINFHSYLIFNGIIAAGYIATRAILGMPFFNRKFSQFQQLMFARYSFFGVVASFILVPVITSAMPSLYHTTFHLEPVLNNASITFLKINKIVNTQLGQAEPKYTIIPVIFILLNILLIGCCFSILNYMKNIFILRKIKQNSFCQRKINNIHILFNQTAEMPFCWSFLKNHFVIIPNSFLEKDSDLRLAASHELQHIRQGDTRWLHFFMLIKACCFWNFFVKKWITWFDELQEFSCDEAIILRKKIPAVVYAQCLINTASGSLKSGLLPQGVLGIQGLSKSMLYRRVNMLFNYRNSKSKKLSIFLAYAISFFIAVSTAYAFNGSSASTPLSVKQVGAIIKQSHLDDQFQVSATPEVVSEINNIRSSDQARTFMRESLQRMKQYQPVIKAALKKNAMPNELLAVPLVESGYEPLDQSKNPVFAAGIWQIIPSTAKRFDLVVNATRDDRLDTSLSTKAALAYLNQTYKQFNDWKLAVIAYEIGEKNTDQLIQKTGSRDAWILARSHAAPEDLKKFLTMFDSTLIIMHNPSLVTERL